MRHRQQVAGLHLGLAAGAAEAARRRRRRRRAAAPSPGRRTGSRRRRRRGWRWRTAARAGRGCARRGWRARRRCSCRCRPRPAARAPAASASLASPSAPSACCIALRLASSAALVGRRRARWWPARARRAPRRPGRRWRARRACRWSAAPAPLQVLLALLQVVDGGLEGVGGGDAHGVGWSSGRRCRAACRTRSARSAASWPRPGSSAGTGSAAPPLRRG